MTDALILRPPVASELPLITQTYVREAKRSLRATEKVGPAWDGIAERFLAACIEDGHVTVCGTRDGAVCAGYALGVRQRGPRGADRAIVHWVYVRGGAIYRGRGIAKRLVEHLTHGCTDVRVTHSCSRRQSDRITREGWAFARSMPWLWLLARENQAA